MYQIEDKQDLSMELRGLNSRCDMSRRSSAIRRDLLPDPRYDSVEVSKFINNLMIDGKNSLSERIFYEALDICQEKSGQPGLTVFTQALNNWKP